MHQVPLPKTSLTMLITGAQSTPRELFTQYLTAPFLPSVSVHHHNGCTLTRTVVDAPRAQTLFGKVGSPSPNAMSFDESKSIGSRFSGSHYSGQRRVMSPRGDLDICFWELFPDEHLWNRVKALNLYEKANAMILLYNVDDAASFEALQPVIQDFCNYNEQSAYLLLIGVVSKDLWEKKTTRVVKKSTVARFMDEMGIPSYAEVFIEGPRPVNMDLINRHVKLIMASFLEHMKNGTEKGSRTYLFKPIFEPLKLKVKKGVRSTAFKKTA